MDMLTQDEFRTLVLWFADTPYANVIRFIAYSGCRPADAAALTWADVDFEQRRALMLSTKTGSRVAVPLVGELLAAVKAEQGRNPVHVFTDQRGTPLTATQICSMIRYQSKKALGRAVGPKLFRRNVVSTLINAGADREHVRALTGHRSDAIARYLHVSESAAHGLAERLQKVLKNDTK